MSLHRSISIVLFFALTTLCPVLTHAQVALHIRVQHDNVPVPGATVVVSGASHATDLAGTVSVSVALGVLEITASKEGFVSTTKTVTVQAGQNEVTIDLQSQPAHEETVTVSATRTGARLEDQPMRVEVLEREEIEEKMLMTPGDIVMMLNEMGGMRVQTTSPSLGAASVRIQGMRGRYTRFFSDGLPLFGEVGGLGLLQIPPMDLGQVEVIKGVASSLYGAGAMGGVVNLISRRPGVAAEREVLVNRSTRGGTDIVGWYSTATTGGWAFTLLGGGHGQTATDVNGDAWTDLPGYARAVVRPRVFWDDGKGRSFFATVGYTAEDREGGTVDDAALSATGLPYAEALDTRRVDGGAVGQLLFRDTLLLSVRGAVSQARHDHQFGEIRERDRHDTAFGEVTLRAIAGRQTFVAGFAIERDAYRPQDVPQFEYAFVVPGVFAQADVEVTKWFSLSGSGRLDHHSEYGMFFSPRAAALFRAGRWNSRLSIGAGFFGPSPLTEETEATGLTRFTIPSQLVAEEGRSVSFDVSRTDGPLSYTVTVFGSRVEHPINVDRSSGLELSNLAEPATNVGMELVGSWRQGPYALTGTYTYVRAREVVAGLERDSTLTPRHSAGLVGMWEREDVGRVGVELYYTGAQALEENPYREISRPYVILGLLAERQFGRVRLFINGENLTGVRQTRWDPLLRDTRAPDGRWTVDAWAPLEGRNVNGGLRVRF